jgi:hypothetical protein
VTPASIEAKAIGVEHIQQSAITAAKIARATMGQANFAPLSVSTDKFADGTLDWTQLDQDITTLVQDASLRVGEAQKKLLMLKKRCIESPQLARQIRQLSVGEDRLVLEANDEYTVYCANPDRTPLGDATRQAVNVMAGQSLRRRILDVPEGDARLLMGGEAAETSAASPMSPTRWALVTALPLFLACSWAAMGL